MSVVSASEGEEEAEETFDEMRDRIITERYTDDIWFSVCLARKLWKIVDDPSKRNLWRFIPNSAGELPKWTGNYDPSPLDQFTSEKTMAELEVLNRQFPFGEVRVWKRTRSEIEAEMRQWFPDWVGPKTPTGQIIHLWPTPPKQRELEALGLGDHFVDPWAPKQQAELGPVSSAPPPARRSRRRRPLARVLDPSEVTGASPSTRRTRRRRTGTHKGIQQSEISPLSLDDKSSQRTDSTRSGTPPTSRGGSASIPLRRSERIKNLARRGAESDAVSDSDLDSNRKLKTRRLQRTEPASRSTRRITRRRN